jgi:hypothetical protein
MTREGSFESVDNFETCAALEGFTPEQRESLIEEAWEIIGQRQQVQRERSGRWYLEHYKDRPYLWYLAFESWPQLENELTPEQQVLWDKEKLEIAERIARERARAELPERLPLKFPERKPQ